MSLVAIVGGAGAMGSYFAEVFSRENYEILIIDINSEKGETLAKEKGYTFMHPQSLEESNVEFDVLLFSVLPISETYNLIDSFSHMVKKGGLLTDVTSVKIRPMEHMLANSGPEIAVVGMHPMYRPDLSMNGQRVILTPGRDNENRWQKRLEDIITKNGGIVKVTTPENHDYIMAVIQGLTHTVSMVSLGTLRDIDADLEELMEYSSPVYRMLFDLMTRTTSGKSQLYSDIQLENPVLRRVFDAFNSAFERHRGIVESSSEERFKALYETLRNFGAKYAKQAAVRVARIEGSPRGVTLYFEESIVDEIRKRVDGKVERYKKNILTIRGIDPGHLTKFYREFPLAQYTQERDSQKEEAHVAFFVRNFKHPYDQDEMIRFSPVVTVTPEKEPLRYPQFRMEQLINFYADPVLNFFDTINQRGYLRNMPHFIVYRVS